MKKKTLFSGWSLFLNSSMWYTHPRLLFPPALCLNHKMDLRSFALTILLGGTGSLFTKQWSHFLRITILHCLQQPIIILIPLIGLEVKKKGETLLVPAQCPGSPEWSCTHLSPLKAEIKAQPKEMAQRKPHKSNTQAVQHRLPRTLWLKPGPKGSLEMNS